MKHLLLIIATALSLSTPFIAQAQKARPAPLATEQTAQLASQRVERYLIDSYGDVDGLLLSDGWLVKFPKHQADDLLRAVRPGDSITATGATTSPRVLEAWTLTNTASNSMIVRAPKNKLIPKLPKHLRAMSLQPLEASGQISHVLRGKKGEVKSVVLADGTALRLGKQAQWALGMQLSVGRDVHARGVGTQNEFGRAFEVTEIGLDGSPMVALYGAKR